MKSLNTVTFTFNRYQRNINPRRKPTRKKGSRRSKNSQEVDTPSSKQNISSRRKTEKKTLGKPNFEFLITPYVIISII
jgi:hypothetical protein